MEQEWIFNCVCGYSQHRLTVTVIDSNDPFTQVLFSIDPVELTLWQRIKAAIRLVRGGHDAVIDYADIVLKNQDVVELTKALMKAIMHNPCYHDWVRFSVNDVEYDICKECRLVVKAK